MFLLPVVALLYVRLRKVPVENRRPHLKLFYRCLSVLLAYMMLISPVCLNQLAKGAVDYSSLDARQWHEGNREIIYTYDDNGSCTSKTTYDTSPDPNEIIEEVTYDYNLRNRLERIVTDTDSDSGTNDVNVADYTYNDNGIRVEKYTFTVAQNYLGTEDEQTYATDTETVTYLIDNHNHTGYAQVLEQTNNDGRTTYTIGDDVITRHRGYGTLNERWCDLLYDGLGSTRQLFTHAGNIADTFSYDAYGVMLGGNPTTQQKTNLLYAGEQWDIAAQSYYLRARYYDPGIGRFNRADDFPGNNLDPQSLHKYIYTHGNPVNGIDPSGRFTIGGLALGIALVLCL